MQFFKHYSDARKSPFNRELLRSEGVEAYGYYNLLLCVLTDKFKGVDDKICVHIDDLLEGMEIKHERKLNDFLEKVNQVSDEVQEKVGRVSLKLLTISKNFYYFEAPILFDLQGKDFKYATKQRQDSDPKKEEERIKNKKKEKKEKENDDKSSGAPPLFTDADIPNVELIATPQKIFDLWNSGCSKYGLPKLMTLNDQRRKKIAVAIKSVPMIEDWKKIFEVTATKGFIPKSGNPFVPNFDYAFRDNRYVQFLEGYDVEPMDEQCDDQAVIEDYLRAQGVPR